MNLYFVRHGEADPSMEGTPLTEKGILQSKVASRELQGYNFDKVYSSNLLRAKQTCEEFTNDYIEDDRLGEVYRVLIGGPIKVGTRKNREEEDCKDADSIFDELLNLDCENVLVFCHANIIRYFISKVEGLNGRNLWKDMVIDNCSITVISNSDDELNIEMINGNDYLVKGNPALYIDK